ncbi:choice-of-anchor A family protein [Kitasatospora sp. NPDC056327]|uniref:choice-of-anchor A family protein n=1 Tax=Kitasatospora sp. NPDC056327 TaxID=3345785 RepID=UPI0035DDC2C4
MSQSTGTPGHRRPVVERVPAPRGRRNARIAAAAATALLPFAAVLTIGSAAPLAPPLGACTGPECPAAWPPVHNGDFPGRDGAVTVFTGGSYTVTGRAAEAEGRIVTLGDFTVDKNGGGNFNAGVVGVGSRVVPPNGSDYLTVGGNVTVQPGNSLLMGGFDSTGQAYGNLRHAGTLTGTVAVDPPGEVIPDAKAAAPYRSVLTRIEDVSTCVGRATATGTVALTASEATFTGDGTSMKQVFNVTGNLTSPTGGQIGLVFDGVPAGATVVVNMLSADPVINTYTGTGLADDPMAALRSKLMWNFPTSTSAQINGTAQFQGSVLAGNPAGTTTIDMPGMNGRVYLAGNLVQTGNGGYEIHSYPFDGDLPDCEVTPTPTPTVTPTPSPTETTPTPSPTETTASPTPSPTETSASPSPTETTASPSPTVTPSPTETSASPTLTASPSPSPTETTASPTPTSPAPTPTGSATSAVPTSPTATSSASGAAPGVDGPTAEGPTTQLPLPANGGGGGGGGGRLASTGSDNAPMFLGIGAGLIVLGGIAVLAARRRGRHG